MKFLILSLIDFSIKSVSSLYPSFFSKGEINTPLSIYTLLGFSLLSEGIRRL